MVEKQPRNKGVVWDPDVDCTPGRPENQLPVVEQDAATECEPAPGPARPRRVRRQGPTGPKTIVEKGNIEHGVQE
jgi:hypothetical protein